jgi:hypothetical protein
MDKTGLPLMTSALDFSTSQAFRYVGKSPAPLRVHLGCRAISSRQELAPRADLDALLNQDTGQQAKVHFQQLDGCTARMGYLYLALPGFSSH